MLADNLKLLVQLYVRPRAALAAIIDEGSFFFGLAAVVILSLASSVPSLAIFASAMSRLPAQASLHRAGPARNAPAPVVAGPDADEGSPLPAVPMSHWLLAGAATGLGFSSLLSVAGLVVLYVPAVIFIMTLVDRRAGSFGVALARDYGQLAPCVLMAWTAARLPFVLLSIGLALRTEPWAVFGGLVAPLVGGSLYFALLATLAVRLVYGGRSLPALVAVVSSAVVLPFAPYLSMLASPFILYWAFIYLRGDISAIQWSLGSRRSFRRHLEAATVNPRDAEAHYQLGLVHQHRRQYPEAIARFQKAIEIDRGEIDAYYQLGRIAREQGRQADAIRYFEEVVTRDPKHSRHEIWREVGATYVEAGDFVNARPMLERYVENRPYDPEGLFWFGLALKRLGEDGKSGEMRARCVEATKTAPDYRKGELRHWRKRAQQEL
jgi:Tetratricopeptide repeat